MLPRTVRVYGAYFAKFVKSRLAYRGDFIASLFGNLLFTSFGLFFVFFLMDGETITDLNGWSRAEVLFIYGYSMIPFGLFSVLSPNLFQFGDRYIIQGQFDRVLLRPLSSLAQVLFESFNVSALGGIVVGALIISYVAPQLGLSLGFLDFAWLVLSSLSGAIILLSVFVILASMSFHFEDRIGVSAPIYNLVSFGRYPLPIFNNTIQFVLRWVFPFAFVSFYPATHFLSRTDFRLYCYMSPLMAVASSVLALFAWRLGVRKYASTGS